MTAAEAKLAGYELVKASPYEVGLLKNGKGIRTWWARDFDCALPTLEHPLIQEAIRITEEHTSMSSKPQNVLKTPLLSIEEQFQALYRGIFKNPPPPDSLQYKEQRKMFFAGYCACFQVTTNGSSDYSEERMMKYLSAIHDEIIEYEKGLRAEVATWKKDRN